MSKKIPHEQCEAKSLDDFLEAQDESDLEDEERA